MSTGELSGGCLLVGSRGGGVEEKGRVVKERGEDRWNAPGSLLISAPQTIHLFPYFHHY